MSSTVSGSYSYYLYQYVTCFSSQMLGALFRQILAPLPRHGPEGNRVNTCMYVYTVLLLLLLVCVLLYFRCYLLLLFFIVQPATRGCSSFKQQFVVYILSIFFTISTKIVQSVLLYIVLPLAVQSLLCGLGSPSEYSTGTRTSHGTGMRGAAGISQPAAASPRLCQV